jgi:NAD(P)-dependent dehydrogenase (short-subunit alcohol dehydrogenase family)
MPIFTKHSTADEVLGDLDLSGKHYLVTGCASGIGLETLRSLAAHGAHVIGTARSLGRAKSACDQVAGLTTPIACDQDDFASVVAAVKEIRALEFKFDAIIANAGIMGPKQPDVRFGIESQFRVNHLSHMLLVTRLSDLLCEGSGRLVIVSSAAAQSFAPKEGVVFDNLDASRGYKPFTFYGQSKLANLAFAKSMAELLQPRGITANALHPGVIFSTDLIRYTGKALHFLMPLMSLFSKSIAQGAATTVYLAAHPAMAGKTGGFYADCQPSKPNPHADDPSFRQRLWEVSDGILAQHAPAA